MKLKTRSKLTFVLIVVIPLLLSVVTVMAVKPIVIKEVALQMVEKTEDGLFTISLQDEEAFRRIVTDTCVAIFIILVFTALMLTIWINKSIIDPINQLNVAMTKIKDGNFDYRLETDSKGEIGELYRNYEDMRLSLKEST